MPLGDDIGTPRREPGLNIFLPLPLKRFMSQAQTKSRGIRTFLSNRRFEIVTLGLVIVYSVLFSYLTILRYRSLHASAYDLGIYNQSLFSTLNSGRFFYYTADLPANPGGSIFGAHFLPILFVILPFYALSPSVETILIIQSLVLGLGAVPVYFLGEKLTSRKNVGLFFAILYLTSPLVHGINWFDFHPEAFLPLPMLTAIYGMHARMWKLYFTGILLALASLEFSAALTALYAMIVAFENRATIVSMLRSRRMLEPGPVAILTFGVSAVWAVLSILTIRAFNPANAFLFGGLSSWSVLGASSLIMVPVKALLDPYRAALALSYDFPLKILYVGLVFAPYGLVLKGALKYVLISSPWAFVSLMSNLNFYYLLNNQYTAFFVPFIFAGSLYGFKQLVTTFSGRSLLKRVCAGMILPALVVGLLASPLVSVPLAANALPGTYGILAVGQHERLVSDFVSLMPSDASVLTQPNIFPLVSSRVNAFLFPYQTYYPPGTSFNSTLAEFMQESEFILLDTKTDLLFTTWIIRVLNESPTHGVYAAADGVLLLRKAYQGLPILYAPLEGVWSASNLHLRSGSIVNDPSSIRGDVLLHSTSDGNGTIFWSGPNATLPPGQYRVDFRLKLATATEPPIIRLGVVANEIQVLTRQIVGQGGGYNLLFFPGEGPSMTLAQMSLYGGSFTAYGVYQAFSLTFSLSGNAHVSFTGDEASNDSDLYLDQITLTQISPEYVW